MGKATEPKLPGRKRPNLRNAKRRQAGDIVEYRGENARSVSWRRLSVLESMLDEGKITPEQCDAGRDLAGMLERVERSGQSASIVMEDIAPSVVSRGALAGWTVGRRTPPPQLMPYTKAPRRGSDGLSEARLDAMNDSRRAHRILETMDQEVRTVIRKVCCEDLTVTRVAIQMRGKLTGASRKWVERRLLTGLNELAEELRPALKEVA